MYKRLFSLFLVFVTLFLFGGCKSKNFGSIYTDDTATFSSKTNAEKRKERVVSEAMEYLNENYPDDEFTYVSGRSPDWAYPYYELAFTTKKYGDQEFTVYGSYKNSEDSNEVAAPYFPKTNPDVEFEYCDTYYEYYMKEDAEKYFTGLGNEYIGNIETCDVIFANKTYFAKQVDNDSSFKENYENSNLRAFAFLTTTIDLSNNKQPARNMAELFLNMGLETSISVRYRVEGDNDFNGLVTYDVYNGNVKENSN